MGDHCTSVTIAFQITLIMIYELVTMTQQGLGDFPELTGASLTSTWLDLVGLVQLGQFRDLLSQLALSQFNQNEFQFAV